MDRYLIEVKLPSNEPAGKRINEAVQRLGSHFATHANWTRADGVCTGTIVIEAPDRSLALGIVPPGLRPHTSVFRLETAMAT
jgi:hypothetical protein